jgi:aryl-alcohol dehydrogenase-like predicted oxidoreductase
MTALALGTVQFGLDYGVANRRGQVSAAEAGAILLRARESGMDTLDTAVAYGDSEQRLGAIGVQGWRIVSKLPRVPDGCRDIPDWVTSSVRASLQKLDVPSLSGLLLHRPQQLREACGADLHGALGRLVADGLVERIGLSIYDPAELEILDDYPSLTLIQAPFNLLDRRLIDTGWLERLEARRIELHVRSVFLQGLLVMRGADRPQTFDRWSAIWSRFDRWLGETGLTAVEACVRYALSFSAIARVVIGVDSLGQLEDVLRAAVGPAPEVPDALHTEDLDLLNPVRWAVR